MAATGCLNSTVTGRAPTGVLHAVSGSAAPVALSGANAALVRPDLQRLRHRQCAVDQMARGGGAGIADVRAAAAALDVTVAATEAV